MAKHNVKCRICGEYFDAQLKDLDIVYVMPSKGWYYHKKCYDGWKKSTPDEDEQWKLRIYDYLAHDIKISYNYFKCEKFLEGFIKRDKKGTYKGCFFALKYFYEIEHGDRSKANGGVGIIPYIYSRSVEYWTQKEKENRGIIASIEDELKKREKLSASSPARRMKKEKQKKEPKWNLEDIE